MLKKLIVSCLAVAALNTVPFVVQAQQYATAILDKTGSMRVMRTDGKSRCQYGKELFLTTVVNAMGRADYLNVKVFGSPGEMRSLSNGFVDIRGFSPVFGAGKVFFDDIAEKVNALSCNSGSTALGDAICDSADEIRTYVAPSTPQLPRLAIVTDAGENYSRYCGGTNYVERHIVPRLANPAPGVRMDVSILTSPGGNVSRSLLQGGLLPDSFFERNLGQSFEDVPMAVTKANISPSSGYSSEIEALIRAAERSGGGAIVIQDDKTCTSNCDPISQGPGDDDWGGAW